MGVRSRVCSVCAYVFCMRDLQPTVQYTGENLPWEACAPAEKQFQEIAVWTEGASRAESESAGPTLLNYGCDERASDPLSVLH